MACNELVYATSHQNLKGKNIYEQSNFFHCFLRAPRSIQRSASIKIQTSERRIVKKYYLQILSETQTLKTKKKTIPKEHKSKKNAG